MPSDTDIARPLSAKELKDLGSTITDQIRELVISLAEVRFLLKEEARRMKVATGPSARPFSRSKGAPVTIIHGPKGVATIPGHPILPDPPPSPPERTNGSARKRGKVPLRE